MEQTAQADPRSWKQVLWRLAILAGCLSVPAFLTFLTVLVPYVRESMIANEIHSFGGHAYFEDTTPFWITQAYGVRLPFCDRIYEVNLSRNSPQVGLLRKVGALTSLRELYLEGTLTDDVVIGSWGNLPKLEKLSLRRTRITDLGLKRLRASRLRFLALDDTSVTDTGIAHIGMIKVRELNKPYYMTGLHRLESLSLANTKITDACLQHLTGLSYLKQLNVQNTKCTVPALLPLQKDLPECRIYY